MHKMSIETSSY